VEKLTQQLLQQRTIKPRFRLPLTAQQAYSVILAAYKAEVASRHRTFIESRALGASLVSLAKALTAEKPKFGIMLCGTYGNGKTTCLYALRTAIGYLADRHVIEADSGLTVLSAKDIAMGSKDYDRFRALRSRPMLAIDDMGREPVEVMDYGNALSPLVDLFEYRYSEQLFTLITTNLTAEEIRTRYKARLADRFNEMLSVIVFADGSFRSAGEK